MILVSAIYSNGVDSIIGGRGRNIDFYLSSLRNIASLEVPFILYTEPENVEQSYYLLSPYFQYLKILPYKLSDFIYYDQFIDWKSKNVNFNTYLNDRNEILCYSKPYWVKDVIEKEYFKELNKEDQYLWIDSGLTHHGIFPEKVGGVELLVKYNNQYYYPHNKNNIFSPILIAKLSNYISSLNKLFFCSLEWQGDSFRILELLHKYHINNSSFITAIKQHLIGGIFGGNKLLFLDFYEKYSNLLKIFIENGIHSYEEQIFSALNYMEPELLHTEHFDTWWFYSPGEPNSFLSSEANSFYKIFANL